MMFTYFYYVFEKQINYTYIIAVIYAYGTYLPVNIHHAFIFRSIKHDTLCIK